MAASVIPSILLHLQPTVNVAELDLRAGIRPHIDPNVTSGGGSHQTKPTI
jgi:hypothetical protein